jgi:uncharacterized protein (DUF58 family)
MWLSKRKNDQAREAGARPATSAHPPLPPQLLRQLQWPVLLTLAVALGGEERAPLRTTGLELSELREYQPGDDVRHVDWNVSARADRPFVRLSQAERALDVWLLLDTSASLDWGTAGCLKRDHAHTFALAAAYLLSRRGNRVGALLFGAQPGQTMAPAAGRTHLLRLLAWIQAPPSSLTRRGATDLAAALERARLCIPRRSLVLVVSDFLAADGWQRQLRRLTARHEVVAVRIADPREAQLPDIGIVTFEDPETGAQLTLDTGDTRLRERFRLAAQAQSARIAAALATCGVDHLVLSTDQEVVPALVAFLRARQARAALPVRLPAGAARRLAPAPAS